MHYHLEVIMPPSENIEQDLEKIMKRFSEDYLEEDEQCNCHSFYDYYVIGGRWSGKKLKAELGIENINSFHEILSNEKITVSSFTAGKQTLEPADQIDKVNKLWNDFFPSLPVKVCPIFDNYDESYGDISTLANTPLDLTCDHVIIADANFEAEYMIQTEPWNGVDFIKSEWDGQLEKALNYHENKIENCSEEFKLKNTPNKDWLVITVDYHN